VYTHWRLVCGEPPVKYARVLSCAAMNFDTEKFIVEIQQREAIWNCEGAVYKNLKRKQWEELVDIFGKEEMTTEAKKSLGKYLLLLLHIFKRN
jgi:hypothetical protein